MRKIVGVLLCCLGPIAFIFVSVENRLLRMGLLNTKDMPPFIGDETGTVSEYLLNVWHWDAIGFLLMLSSLPGLYVGVRLLSSAKHRNGHHFEEDATLA